MTCDPVIVWVNPDDGAWCGLPLAAHTTLFFTQAHRLKWE